MSRRALALAAAILATGGATTLAAAPAPRIPHVRPGPTTPLTIASGGKVRRFMVEVAATPDQQEQGLMYRRSMPRMHGMIFPMDPPRPTAFWMKNTYIPLDIVFLRPDRTVIGIAAKAQPLSEKLIRCPEQVGAVLELNGGVAASIGLKEGDKISW